MTISGTGVVLCRLASIFFVVQALGYSGFLLQQLLDSTISRYGFVGASVVAVLVPGIAAVVTWRFGEKISTIEHEDATTELAEGVGTDQLVLVGTFLVGLYTVLLGMESAVRVEVINWVQEATNLNSTHPSDTEWLQRLPNRLSYAAQLILGTVLMTGRNVILRMFHWARYSGRSFS